MRISTLFAALLALAVTPALAQTAAPAPAPITAAQWTATVAAAKPGTVIDLGTQRVTFARVKGLHDVTIKGGVFGAIILDNWSNVTFTGTTFSPLPADRVLTGYAPPLMDAYSPVGLTITNVTFTGYTDSLGNLQPHAIKLRGGSNVAISGSTFQSVGAAVSFERTAGGSFTGNTLSMVREGIDLAGATNITISGNRIGPFRPAAADHPDAIQMWTQGLTLPTDTAARNILIENNLVDPGVGYRSQGVFMGDELNLAGQGRGYDAITIRGNVFVGTGWNGIAFGGGTNLLVENNTLLVRLGPDGVTDNWIYAKAGTGTVRNNVAGSFNLPATIATSGNTASKTPATDAQIAAATSTLAAALASAPSTVCK